MSSAEWRPFCLGCNVLKERSHEDVAALVPLILSLYNSSPPRQNGCPLADDVLKSIFLKKKKFTEICSHFSTY